MSKERKVIRVFSPKMGDEGWKTVRFALRSTARTVRLVVLIFALSLPSLAAAFMVVSRWL